MTKTWVTDLTDFLDEHGRVPDLAVEAIALTNYLGKIIAFVKAKNSTFAIPSVKCRRRPDRKPCPGKIETAIEISGFVIWRCPSCGENGHISNWQGTPWDRNPTNFSSVFSGPARKVWEEIDPQFRIRLLNNVWCSNCKATGGIILEQARLDGGDLVLYGGCPKCSMGVVRMIETSQV